MRRFHFGLLAAALPVLLVSFVLVGCGSKKSDDDDDDYVRPSKGGKQGKLTPAKKLEPIKAKDGKYASIKGKVVWKGDKLNFDEMTAELKKTMEAKDKTCLMDAKEVEVSQQMYRIGKNRNLGNVFIWVVPAESGRYLEASEDTIQKLPKEVRISQPHCTFLPHCSIFVPKVYKNGELVPTGQKLIIENDAKVAHNAKVDGGTDNPAVDSQLAPGSTRDYNLTPSRNYVTVSCGIHPWMRGYLRVFDHPFATVSSVGANLAKKEYENLDDLNFGTYEIVGLPVGAKVRIIAWHESDQVGERGFLAGPTGKELTVGETNAPVDFEAKTK